MCRAVMHIEQTIRKGMEWSLNAMSYFTCNKNKVDEPTLEEMETKCRRRKE
jgi:hypothetical protein